LRSSMEDGGYDLISSDSFAELPPACVEDIVDQLTHVLQEVLSKQMQTLSAKLMGRLETMSQELVSKQNVALQRLIDVVTPNIAQRYPAQNKREATTSQPEEVGRRSTTLPDELLCDKTASQKSQKEYYQNLLHRARCRSQTATASRLRLLHSDQLVRKSGKSPTECTVRSSPSVLVQHVDSSSSSVDSLRLEESKKNQRNRRFHTDPTATGDFQKPIDEDDNKEEIDDEGDSTNEHNRDIVRTTGVSTRVLPGSVQDDVNFSNVLPSSSTIKKMKHLRAETEASIVAGNLQKVSGREDVQDGNPSVQTHTMRAASFLLKVWAFWGIVPWSTHVAAQWYRQVVVFLTGCAAVYSIFELVHGQGGLLENIANFSLYICVFLNLVFLRHMGEVVGPFNDQCAEYARAHNFCPEWGKGGILRLIVTVTVWAATTSLICVAFVMRSADNFTDLLMAWRDGLLLAILHCLWQVVAFLELMVDSYCIEFFACLDCHWGVSTWNGLQALLRRVAEKVENCFLAVQSAMTVAVFCCTARLVIVTLEHRNNMEAAALDGVKTVILVYIRLLLIVLVVLALFAKAASVTDKCSKVAPLVNSVTFEEDDQIHYERQYLVSYIIQSDAGFYVKGSRFTVAMLMKCCYVFGTIICAMGTTILSMGQKK